VAPDDLAQALEEVGWGGINAGRAGRPARCGDRRSGGRTV